MYTYEDLQNDFLTFKHRFGLPTGFIGKTVLGAGIPFVYLGHKRPRKTVLVQGAIHAREHITSALITEQIYHYLHNKTYFGYGGIYFIPMVNIDGVRLCEEGADFIKDSARREFLLNANNGNGADFTYWKANADAVDLNTNFPARWGTGKENVTAPAPANYIGAYPASEPETRALIEFTNSVRPSATISYHCKGEEIYWEFFQNSAAARRDRALAEGIAKETGYAVIDELASAGGYKDWYIQGFSRPGFTLEVGNINYPYPFPYEQLPVIFEQNKNVPYNLLHRI